MVRIIYLLEKEQRFIEKGNKQYYKDLEEKVKALEEEVKELRNQLKYSQVFHSHKLEEEEKYFYQDLPKFIEVKPDEFRFSMYES